MIEKGSSFSVAAWQLFQRTDIRTFKDMIFCFLNQSIVFFLRFSFHCSKQRISNLTALIYPAPSLCQAWC